MYQKKLTRWTNKRRVWKWKQTTFLYQKIHIYFQYRLKKHEMINFFTKWQFIENSIKGFDIYKISKFISNKEFIKLSFLLISLTPAGASASKEKTPMTKKPKTWSCPLQTSFHGSAVLSSDCSLYGHYPVEFVGLSNFLHDSAPRGKFGFVVFSNFLHGPAPRDKFQFVLNALSIIPILFGLHP